MNAQQKSPDSCEIQVKKLGLQRHLVMRWRESRLPPHSHKETKARIPKSDPIVGQCPYGLPSSLDTAGKKTKAFPLPADISANGAVMRTSPYNAVGFRVIPDCFLSICLLKRDKLT